MRILIDTSLLVEGERRKFDLGKWVVAARHEVLICDATIAEYIAGKPVKDAGKEQRWQNYWASFVSLLDSVPLDHQICRRAGEMLADARRAGKTVSLVEEAKKIGSCHLSKPNIKLDLARRWTNADGMKWKAARLLPLTLKVILKDRLQTEPSLIC